MKIIPTTLRACFDNATGARAVPARSGRVTAFVRAATGDRSRAGNAAVFSKHALSSIGLSVALITAGGSVAQAAATFQGLGKLPGGENSIVGSFAHGLSADGLVVVGYSGSANVGQEAFRWTAATGMVGLGDLPGGYFISAAAGVSADGSVVVGNGSTEVLVDGFLEKRGEPFRWTASTGMVSIGLLPGAPYNGYATDVSADGSLVVGTSSATNSFTEAFRWTAADGMVSLGLLAGDSFSAAFGVSGDGTVVVGHSGREVAPGVDTTEAIRWSQGDGVQGLGDLPGGATSSAARGISADGSVVVGWGSTEDGTAPFRWTVAGGMQSLGTLPGNHLHGQATDASADGSVIVGWSGDTREWTLESVAFIWDEQHGRRDLRQLLINQGADLTGWTLADASAVSDDGRTIVGRGLNPAGEGEAWIATLALSEPTLPFLTIQRSGETIRLIIRGAPGSVWNLQQSPDLGEWETVRSVSLESESEELESPLPSADRGFWRLASP